jgi:phosphoribosylformylglycinamidine cyclo-ligase
MFNTFNMGVGMSIVVPKEQADLALATLREAGEAAYIIGEVIRSDEGIILC